jgi:iron complex outermembrane receptor protein
VGGGAFLTEAYERVVVSSSRYSQAPLDAASSVTILTADDIRTSGAVLIHDVLRRAVGVDVMSMSSSLPYVGIRGFNGELNNKVLWLMDGRPIAWDFVGTVLTLSLPVGLDEIERIEVIRGPGSAIYGANAVTGIINIITRAPGEGPRQTMYVTAGSPGITDAGATASGRAGDLAWRVGGGYLRMGRWAKEDLPDEATSPYTLFQPDQDLADQRFRGDARLDWKFLDKGLASVSGGFVQGRSEYYSIGELFNFGLNGSAGFLRGDLSWGPGHARVYWAREDGNTRPWVDAVDRVHDLVGATRNDTFDIELEGNLPLQTGEVAHRLHVGGGYTYKHFRFDYFAGDFETPWIEHHGKLFASYRMDWKQLGFEGSLRFDRHPLVDPRRTLSPRATVLVRVTPTTTVRAGFGTAYRAMNGLESYMDLELPTSADGYYVRYYGGQTDPNGRDLVPERVLNAELAVRDESSPYHTLDVALYWNRVTNLIGLAPVNPTLSPFDPERAGFQYGASGWINQSDTTWDSVGGEAAAELFPVRGLDIFANTAIQTTLRAGPDGSVVDRQTSTVKANLGVTWRSPWRFDASLAGHFASGQVWRLREFDTLGNIAIVERGLPARMLMVARVAARPIQKPELELAATLWNPVGIATPYREHPEGQPLTWRLLGSAAIRF